MVELKSDWKDLGSWKSIYEISPKDENNNVFIGHVLDKESKILLFIHLQNLLQQSGLRTLLLLKQKMLFWLVKR